MHASAPTTRTAESATDQPAVVARWRARATERRRSRLVSARNRRRLVGSLRRAASYGPERRRPSVVLVDRVEMVGAQLLELADLLQASYDPDPSWVAEIQDLVTDGCGSPLFNSNVHISELLATLWYLREAATSVVPQPAS
jgi:hypothetical protein